MTFYDQISRNKWKSALLVSIFIAFILLLGFLVGYIWGPERAMVGLIIATVVATVMAFTSYYHSDKVALAAAGARPVTREEYPYYVNTVEGLAIAAGLPMPRTYIIDTPAMNAFATGRDPEHAAIAVTTGLLERCNRLELEGVIAHEMSHIKNYDIRLMSMVVVLVGLVVIFSEVLFRMFLFGGGGRRREGGDGEGAGIIYLAIMILGLIFLILSPIIAQLLQLAISRRREFLADANGAMLTRYPEGLASALEKLTREARPFPRASKATAHLFIVQPFRKEGGERIHRRSSIWDTHPPVEERIRRLRAMAGMEGMYTQAQMESRA
ncbi:M48 family metalloprotease [Candidatus Solincola sp.]|nr:M48 family metalloprotease [Actinomycetota bacterium]MDI7250938.1 M48 family metalloprotease [Actinomycetota bacterium]